VRTFCSGASPTGACAARTWTEADKALNNCYPGQSSPQSIFRGRAGAKNQPQNPRGCQRSREGADQTKGGHNDKLSAFPRPLFNSGVETHASRQRRGATSTCPRSRPRHPLDHVAPKLGIFAEGRNRSRATSWRRSSSPPPPTTGTSTAATATVTSTFSRAQRRQRRVVRRPCYPPPAVVVTRPGYDACCPSHEI
jgi:hypothetical protein